MLKIKKPDGVQGWGISFESRDPDKIKKFVAVCNENLSKQLYYFHQSGITPFGLSNYQFFEFFNVHAKDEDSISLMVDECLKIASLMNEELNF